jgi:hypothetical protein
MISWVKNKWAGLKIWTKDKWQRGKRWVFVVILGGGIAMAAPIVPAELTCSVAGNETQFSTASGSLEQGQWANAEEGFVWVNDSGNVRKEPNSFDVSNLQEKQVVGMRYWRECDDDGKKVRDTDLKKEEYEALKTANGIKRETKKTPIESIINEAQAAITHEITASGRNSTGNSITVSITCSGATPFLAITTSTQDSNHANFPVTSATYDGASATFVRRDEPAGNVATEIWYVASPTCDNTANNLVVNVTGSLGELAAGGIVLNGTAQAAPEANNGGSGNGFAPALSVTTVTDNSWLVGAISTEGSLTTMGTNQTIRWTQTDQSFENARGGTRDGVTPAGSTSITFNIGSGQPYAHSVIVVQPAAAAAGGARKVKQQWLIIFE